MTRPSYRSVEAAEGEIAALANSNPDPPSEIAELVRRRKAVLHAKISARLGAEEMRLRLVPAAASPAPSRGDGAGVADADAKTEE